MNHDDERNAFDIWHLKQFKDINDDLNDDEAEHLYQRVYSHESQDLIRQMEFNAWLSSANREGYKLVPVEPKRETIKQMNKVWFESNCAHIMKTKTAELLYKSMIEACDN